MIWKIWTISVLVIITPQETSSSSSSSSKFYMFTYLFNGYLFAYLSICFMFSLFFSVFNFYFTSQYHEFPLSHPAAAAAIYPRAAAAAAIYPRVAAAATTAAPAVEIPPKTGYKQKQNETHYENTTH